MNEQTTTAWQQYEAGKEYKRRIGFYEKARTNERFYKGDQWYESNSDLPRPVFNLVRRIADFAGIPADRVWTFGNDTEDVCMIRDFGGIATTDAHPSATSAARCTAASVCEVVEMIGKGV